MSQQTKHKQTFMESLATFIVDKRNLFFLLTIIGLVFSIFPIAGCRWRTT